MKDCCNLQFSLCDNSVAWIVKVTKTKMIKSFLNFRVDGEKLTEEVKVDDKKPETQGNVFFIIIFNIFLK